MVRVTALNSFGTWLSTIRPVKNYKSSLYSSALCVKARSAASRYLLIDQEKWQGEFGRRCLRKSCGSSFFLNVCGWLTWIKIALLYVGPSHTGSRSEIEDVKSTALTGS